MALLASDDANPQFMGAHNPDAALSVRFYKKPVQNNFQTEKMGRPIFEDLVYIQIFTPGDQLNIIDTPMREKHKQRFPNQWQHFQNNEGADTREMGTPLIAWPLLSAAQAEELKALKFFTVESIANASDAQLQNIGMVGGMATHKLREMAISYLNRAADGAVAGQQAAELAATKDALAALQAQVNAMLTAGIPPVAAEKPKNKGGRPPKARSAELQPVAQSVAPEPVEEP
jgi:hypothetical protein